MLWRVKSIFISWASGFRLLYCVCACLRIAFRGGNIGRVPIVEAIAILGVLDVNA